VDTLKRQLYRMTYGADEERDGPGAALAQLRAEIRRAADENLRRKWGDVDQEPDPKNPGALATTWTSTRLLGEVAADLSRLGTLASESGPLMVMPAGELLAAIEQARAELRAIMARPVREPIDLDDVREPERIPRRDPFDRDGSDGLVPDTRGESILKGTVRFGRKR
jgi:hypothetical protein